MSSGGAGVRLMWVSGELGKRGVHVSRGGLRKAWRVPGRGGGAAQGWAVGALTGALCGALRGAVSLVQPNMHTIC